MGYLDLLMAKLRHLPKELLLSVVYKLTLFNFLFYCSIYNY